MYFIEFFLHMNQCGFADRTAQIKTRLIMATMQQVLTQEPRAGVTLKGLPSNLAAQSRRHPERITT